MQPIYSVPAPTQSQWEKKALTFVFTTIGTLAVTIILATYDFVKDNPPSYFNLSIGGVLVAANCASISALGYSLIRLNRE